MSGRTTGEIALDLRKFIDWYGCDPGVPISAVDVASEAADRLAELDESLQYIRQGSFGLEDDLVAIDALRPPCPTCDDARDRAIETVDGRYGFSIEFSSSPGHHEAEWNEEERRIRAACPDCVDGEVSIEQLAATWRAVWEWDRGTEYGLGHDELWSLYGQWELIDHLRSVKP